MIDNKIKNIKVFNTKGKPLAPTNLIIANTLVGREKAIWIEEGKSLTLLYTKSDFKKLKKKVIKEENRVCYICQVQIPDTEHPTIDHVNPKSKLGKDNRSNLRCCCKRCNDDKGSKNIHQYFYFVKSNIDKYDYIDIEHLERETKKYI